MARRRKRLARSELRADVRPATAKPMIWSCPPCGWRGDIETAAGKIPQWCPMCGAPHIFPPLPRRRPAGERPNIEARKYPELHACSVGDADELRNIASSPHVEKLYGTSGRLRAIALRVEIRGDVGDLAAIIDSNRAWRSTITGWLGSALCVAMVSDSTA